MFQFVLNQLTDGQLPEGGESMVKSNFTFKLHLKLFAILVSEVPYFFISHQKCYGQKVFPRGDSSENVTSYGTIIKITAIIGGSYSQIQNLTKTLNLDLQRFPTYNWNLNFE